MALACSVATTGCEDAGPVRVDLPSGRGSTTGCAELLKTLPDSVLSQRARPVSPAGAPAAAWGNPAIVLRCGVRTPASLEPTSRCDVVNGVGWFSRQDPDRGWVFTTIGRISNVELQVPPDYTPAANVLVELAAAIKNSLPVTHRCV